MDTPHHPTGERRRRVGPGCCGLLVVIALLSLGALWFTLDPMFRGMVRSFVGVDDNPVRIEVSGRVLDHTGAPAGEARVHGAWRILLDGEPHGNGMFNAFTRPDGSFWEMKAFSTDVLQRRPDAIRVELQLQAHGRFEDCEPSEPISLELPDRGETEQELQLGPPRPTVPVHVVDSAGAPVTEFWVRAMPAADPAADEAGARRQGAGGEATWAGPWPQRYKDFPDGVAPLAVPPVPFRVKAYVYGVKRVAVVGPFDPGALPPRIEITLPDR